MMQFREGDRVVISDPDGKFNDRRGIIYPHGEIGGTILEIVNAHTKDCAARVKWDCDVDEHFASHGSYIDIDNLMFEPDAEVEIDDTVSQFIDSM